MTPYEFILPLPPRLAATSVCNDPKLGYNATILRDVAIRLYLEGDGLYSIDPVDVKNTILDNMISSAYFEMPLYSLSTGDLIPVDMMNPETSDVQQIQQMASEITDVVVDCLHDTTRLNLHYQRLLDAAMQSAGKMIDVRHISPKTIQITVGIGQ